MPTRYVVKHSTGLLFHDDFNRSDRVLNGDNDWVADRGTWNIVGSVAVVTVDASGSNRNNIARNERIEDTEYVIEARCRVLSATPYMGVLVVGQSPGTVTTHDGNCHRWSLKQGESYGVQVYDAVNQGWSTDFGVTVASTVWHRLKMSRRVEGPNNNRFDLVQNLDDYQLLDFDVTHVPTPGLGNPGLVSFGGTAVEFDEVWVYSHPKISLGGLEVGWGFRLFDSAGSVVASSGGPTAGTATLNTLTVFDSPHTGYLQAYSDQGTWAAPIDGARYPPSGFDQFYGGDLYELSTEPPKATYTVQIGWTASEEWPAKWTQANADVSDKACRITIDRRAGNPTPSVDTAEIEFDDDDGRFVPGRADSPMYPYVTTNRPMRILGTYQGSVTPMFSGYTALYTVGMRRPYQTTIRCESPLRLLLPVRVTPQPVVDGYVYNAGDLGHSALWHLLEAVGTAPGGFAIPEAARFIDSSEETIEGTWGGEEDTFGSYLEDLACRTNARFWIEPEYRTLSTEQDWSFYWQSRQTAFDRAADWAWDTEEGDADDIVPTFPGDQL